MRSAVDVVLPVAMIVTWILLYAVRRSVTRLFFALAATAAVSCFPIGAWAFARQPAGDDCPLPTACVDYSPLSWWVNGFCGVLTVIALALLSALVRLVQGGSKERFEIEPGK